MSREFLFNYVLTPVAGQPDQFTISANPGINKVTLSDTSDGSGDSKNILGDVAQDHFTANGTAETYAGYGATLFNSGDTSVSGPIGVNGDNFVLYSDQSLAAGTVIQLQEDEPGSDGANQFNLTNSAPVTCYLSGTMIAIPGGEVPVEKLSIGDLVATASGEVRPVKWLGYRTMALRGASAPLAIHAERARPIRVKAGALGDNVPVRDLLISPDHGLLVCDVLVQAGALVNNVTITRETQMDTFTYWHVELDDHNLILADGVASETFIDNVTRMSFDNWAEHQALYGDSPSACEMDTPRVQSARQLPERVIRLVAERSDLLASGSAGTLRAA